MQTFVPYADFNESAAVLDNKRLNKQLLEGRQIYQILASGKTKGAWVNHPAVRMWRKYDNALYGYLVAIKDECDQRGIQTEKNWDAITMMYERNWHRGSGVIMPPWWNDERVHLSHQINLYKKDPDYYAKFYSTVKEKKHISCCDRCNYFWPTHTLFYNAELCEA
jgi:hypothetical protein